VTNEILYCCANHYLFGIFRLRRHPAFKSTGEWPPARLVSSPDKTMRKARSRAVLSNEKYGTCRQLRRSTLRRADLHSGNPRTLRFKALRSLRPFHGHCLQRYEVRQQPITSRSYYPAGSVQSVFRWLVSRILQADHRKGPDFSANISVVALRRCSR